MRNIHPILISALVLLSVLSAPPALAGRRPQMVADARSMAKWIGAASQLLTEESTDGVIVSRFRRIEVSNGDSTWTLKVDCTQMTRIATNVIGTKNWEIPFDVPEPHGFYIRIERKYSETRPQATNHSWERRQDGTAESRFTISPENSPDLWLNVYCHRGTTISDDEAGIIDSIIRALQTSFGESKAEQDGGEQPATRPESK